MPNNQIMTNDEIENKFQHKTALYDYLTVNSKLYLFFHLNYIAKILLPQKRYCNMNFLQQLLEEKKKCLELHEVTEYKIEKN